MQMIYFDPFLIYFFWDKKHKMELTICKNGSFIGVKIIRYLYLFG